MGENPNNPNNRRENTGQGSPVTEGMTQDQIRAYYEKNPSAPTPRNVTTSAPAADYYPGLGSYENTGQGNSATKDMTDDETRAYYYRLNNMTLPAPAPAPALRMTPVYAPAPRMTPVYASAPASAPAVIDVTPSTLWEMDKKYVKTYYDSGRDPVWFYEDDNKKKFPTPMKGFVTKINSSFNPFTKTYIISSDNRSFGVNNVYTTDFDMRSGGGRRKSKKMYKKRNLRKKSKSKSKRRHSHARSHRH
jgi:hypothetical protein